MTDLDPRRHAFRPDLADSRLRGQIEAPRFADGRPHQVTSGSVPLRTGPCAGARLASELLFGETVRVFDTCDGWAWLQNESDGYVGYAPLSGISATVLDRTHIVAALRTYIYPEPDPKSPPRDILSISSSLTLSGNRDGFSELTGGGWVWSGHLVAIGNYAGDIGDVALRFVGAPYLWGGRTSIGLDCSGLVQLALARCGIAAPRDSDMQEQELGDLVDFAGDESALRRGDLVFWPGHVGIWLEPATFVHANASDMMVAAGPFSRIAELIRKSTGDAVSSVRRI